jgi:hypothetical protein
MDVAARGGFVSERPADRFDFRIWVHLMRRAARLR